MSSSNQPYESFQVWGDTDQTTAIFFKIGDGFEIRFPGVADFVIDRAGRWTVRCSDPGDAVQRWRGVFEQHVQPLLVSLRGEQVFHGGATQVGEEAIAFLGQSGRGKSTLTTAFAKRGYAFLSDDCLHLDYSRTRIYVHPHAAHVRLWEDSAAELGEGRSVYVEGSPKPRLEAAADLPHCNRLLPLSRLYLLGDADVDVPTITPLSPSQALIGLTANAFVLDIKNPEVLKRNLAAAARLVREVSMRRLDYPRRYEMLPSVVDAVLADVASAVAG